MKRLLTLFLSATMVMSLMAGCSSSSSTTTTTTTTDSASADSSAEVVTLVLAHCNPEGDPTDLEAIYFAEKVSEYTNGTVEIDIYANSILGDWVELLEGLGLGTCDLMIEGFADLESYSTVAACDALPYVYDGYDHFMTVWHGEVGDQMQADVLADCGIRVFGGAYRGARVVTSTKLFTTAEELADLNLKIRAPSTQIYIDTWTYLETNPTPLALTEVLTALQQGTVEAQENPCILSYNYGFYDVCDYIIKTNHVYSATVFMVDEDNWNAKLTAEQQEAIMKAGEEAAVYCSEYILECEEEYFALWEEAGCTVVEVDITSFQDKLSDLVANEYPELVVYEEMIRSVA